MGRVGESPIKHNIFDKDSQSRLKKKVESYLEQLFESAKKENNEYILKIKFSDHIYRKLFRTEKILLAPP